MHRVSLCLVAKDKTCRPLNCAIVQVQAAFALAAAPTQVAAACAQGVVRLFSSKTLTFRATLPRFVAKGQGQATGKRCYRPTWGMLHVVNRLQWETHHPSVKHCTLSMYLAAVCRTHHLSSLISKTANPVWVARCLCLVSSQLVAQRTLSFAALSAHLPGGEFPDARGCSFQPGSEHYLVVVYADASIIVWNIQDIKKVSKANCTFTFQMRQNLSCGLYLHLS